MLGGSRALAALLGFVAVALVARSLGPAELGLLSMALAVFGWAQHAAECGLRSVVTAETGWRRAFLPLLSTYMILRMSCAAATATVVIGTTYVLAPGMAMPVSWLCGALFAVALQFDWVPLATGRSGEAGLLLLARPCAMLVLLAAIPVETATGVAALTAVAWWCAAALSWPSLRHGRRDAAEGEPLAATRMLRLGWPLMAVALTSQAQLALDLLIVGHLFGPAQAGQYFLASAIVGAGLVLANATGQFAMARMAPLRDNPAAFARELARELRLVGLVVLLGACLLATAAPLVVPAAFGAAYAPVTVLIPWLLPWLLLQSLTTVTQGALTAARRQPQLLRANLALLAALAIGLPVAARYGTLEAFAACRAAAEAVRLAALLIPFLALSVPRPSSARNRRPRPAAP
ncbi:MAG: oligosaccharide flippase family protein [Geminicoccaceae bacterium]|nr:oligosaccharide flippase family protein [Geminicoccaceae bacterium]